MEGAFEEIGLDPLKLWGLLKVENKGELGGPGPSFPESWVIYMSLNQSRSSAPMIWRVLVQVPVTGPDTCAPSFHSLRFSGPRRAPSQTRGMDGACGLLALPTQTHSAQVDTVCD